MKNIIVSTGGIDGKEVEVLGLVKGISGQERDLRGRPLDTALDVLTKEALWAMTNNAKQLGADAVINMIKKPDYYIYF